MQQFREALCQVELFKLMCSASWQLYLLRLFIVCTLSFWRWTGKIFTNPKVAAKLLVVDRNGGLNISYLLTWNLKVSMTSTKLVSYVVLFVIRGHLLDTWLV